MGHLDPDARRPDHVPRRRRRAAGTAAAGPGAGPRDGGQGRRRGGRAAAASCATGCATPASGSPSTTGSTSRSAGGRSTPSCRATRSGSRSGRATSPPATVTLVRRIAGTKTPTPVADAVAAVLAALDADQQALYDEALARRTSTPSTCPLWTTRSPRPRTASSGCPGPAVGAGRRDQGQRRRRDGPVPGPQGRHGARLGGREGPRRLPGAVVLTAWPAGRVVLRRQFQRDNLLSRVWVGHVVADEAAGLWLWMATGSTYRDIGGG